MEKKVARGKKEDGFEMLARLIKEEVEDIRGDIASLYRTMATKEDFVELRRELREHDEMAVDELREEWRPMERSLDKHVLKVADHEVRIGKIEKQLLTQ